MKWLNENKSFRFSLSNYLKVWLLTIFISSFVLTNSLKGSTPAFLFAGSGVFLVFLIAKKTYNKYFRLLLYVILTFVVYQFLSQLILLISPGIPNYSHLVLISNDTKLLFRNSLFTQSIYFFVSIFLFVFIFLYYKQAVHDKYIVLSLIILSTYGYYIWVYYLLTGENGDFISNREFGDGNLNPGHFQTINIGSLSLSRFVSLTGEPSMYVFSVLPITIYLFHVGWYRTSLLLVSTLVLTFSGTLLIGISLYFVGQIISGGSLKRKLVYILVIPVMIWFMLSNEIVRSIVDEILLAKLRQESDSGEDRIKTILDNLVFYWDLPLPVKLFGMGFGFVRSPEFFTTLLVNCGLIGIILFTIAFFIPILKLKSTNKRNLGIKYALFTSYVILITSVSEYSYPCLWLIMGIAYNQMSVEKALNDSYNVENEMTFVEK